MIPILYESTETEFESNGLGRLRDCISCTCVEERNSIYEVDFEYLVTGVHYEDIQVGRIIGVTHDESGDIQPFDIVSYSKPINGIVTFHCVHISYRLNYVTTVGGAEITSLSDIFQIFDHSMPSGYPFNFWTDRESTGYLACYSGLVPATIRSMLGGMRGSVLDTYGGEYEWDKWTVKLWYARGQVRDFSIRYGVNMLDYNEEYDIQGTYSRCYPYWTDGTQTIVIPPVSANGSTITGRNETLPLDLSDKFETKPTTTQLNEVAQAYMNNNKTFLPIQNIHVEFARLQDLGFDEFDNLLECNLCDTINVIFPDFNSSRQFKIVKTVWNVLQDRYESMELGDLSITLAEALGVSSEQEAKNNILNSIYPVGSVYISTNAVSPATLFGGTWSQIQGKFLLAADSNYTAGSTGGEATHTLTVSEMPSHRHKLSAGWQSSGTDDRITYGAVSGDYYDVGYGNIPFMENVGGDGAHNNMPPYLSVYMWERTA